MLHNLTIGHMDTTLVAERGSRVLRPLDPEVVYRHLSSLGKRDGGVWKLDGARVEFHGGYVVVPWLGGRTNRVAEEFAIRVHRDTGCQLIDREHCRIIDPATLVGLPQEPRRPVFPRARRLLKAMGL